MLISAVLMLRYRPPRKDQAALLYQRFVNRSGLEVQTGETAGMFALRVSDTGRLPASAVNEITDAYLDARYGQNDEAAFQRLKTAVSSLV
jgi:hypothetical protein